MLEIMIFVVAICIDHFLVSIAYGVAHIRISYKRILLLNAICVTVLCICLSLGYALFSYIEVETTRCIGIYAFLLLGTIKMFDYSLKRMVRRYEKEEKKIALSISKIRIMVQIYADPMKADQDKSKDLSVRETVLLAGAMSIDSALAGMMIATLEVSVWQLLLCSFVFGVLLMYLGYYSGRKIGKKIEKDMSFMSGVLFYLIAAMTYFLG